MYQNQHQHAIEQDQPAAGHEQQQQSDHAHQGRIDRGAACEPEADAADPGTLADLLQGDRRGRCCAAGCRTVFGGGTRRDGGYRTGRFNGLDMPDLLQRRYQLIQRDHGATGWQATAAFVRDRLFEIGEDLGPVGVAL